MQHSAAFQSRLLGGSKAGGEMGDRRKPYKSYTAKRNAKPEFVRHRGVSELLRPKDDDPRAGSWSTHGFCSQQVEWTWVPPRAQRKPETITWTGSAETPAPPRELVEMLRRSQQPHTVRKATLKREKTFQDLESL